MTREDHHNTTPPEAASLDQVYKLLSHQRRRALLYQLANQAPEPMQYQALIDHLQSYETQMDGDSPGNHRDEIALQLHHVHLPALADAQLIDYNHSTGKIHYHGGPRVETLLDHIAATNPPE